MRVVLDYFEIMKHCTLFSFIVLDASSKTDKISLLLQSRRPLTPLLPAMQDDSPWCGRALAYFFKLAHRPTPVLCNSQKIGGQFLGNIVCYFLQGKARCSAISTRRPSSRLSFSG